MAVNMSQSQAIILDDKRVSRLMAEKAMHDSVFKEQLSRFVRPNYTSTREKDAQAVLGAIAGFRINIVDQAGLQAPATPTGFLRDLNNYLRQKKDTRTLLAKVRQETIGTAGKRETYKWGWVGSPTCVARLALALLQSTIRFQADATAFPFQRLPPELRLQVYRESLGGIVHDGLAMGRKIRVTRNRRKNFQFQLEGQFINESKELNVSLLAANRLVYNEALPVLYQQHTFDFRTNVGIIVPFLKCLPQEARQYLYKIAMELHIKREPRGRGRDNQAAWCKICHYIATSVNVSSLSLLLTIRFKVSADFRTLKWVAALAEIQGLRRFTLIADQQYHLHPVLTRASYKGSSLSADSHCFNEHLVTLFNYLCEQMLE